MDICEETFDLVENHLAGLAYKGPVGLSCDDTKLLGGLRLYWNKAEEAYFLVGAAEGPYRVIDPEKMEEVLKEAKLTKATKAC